MSYITRKCDHCDMDVEVPPHITTPSIVWCGDCIETDRYLLEQIVQRNSQINPATFLPYEEDPYYTWSLSESLKELSSIPKKNSYPACPPTLKNIDGGADVVIGIIKHDADSPLETKILKSREPVICKRAYYGIDCDCGRCN